MTPTDPQLEPVRAALAKCRFRRAVSHQYQSREMSHEYVVEGKAPENAVAILEVQVLINRAGYSRRFGKWTYQYVDLDGFKYWIIQDILNREPLDKSRWHGPAQP